MYHIDELTRDAAALEELHEAVDTLHPTALRCAKIKITSRCNLRCQMCHYWKTQDEVSLTTEAWCRVLDELAGVGCRKVHFSGGEVFLRRDFLDIVEHAAGHGMKVNLTTNATLLTRDRVKRLVRARPNSISISLDGPRAAVHDAIRGLPGSFLRTCRTIRELQRYGERIGHRPRVRINFVMMRDNFRRTPQMLDLAARLGAVELHPMPVDEKGAGKLRLSRSQIESYNRDVAPRVRDLREQYGFSTHPSLVFPFGERSDEIRYTKKGLYAKGFYERHLCLAPWLHLFIAWDGSCYLCCMTNHRMQSLGNVRQTSVQDVFWGERFRKIRAEFLSGHMHGACQRCDMFLTENERLHQALSTTRAAAAAPLQTRSDIP